MKLRSVQDLWNDLNGRCGGLTNLRPSGINDSYTSWTSKSFIFVEFFGGPSTGPDGIKFIQLNLDSWSSTKRWQIERKEGANPSKMDKVYKWLDTYEDDIHQYISQMDCSAMFKDLYKGAMLQMVAKMPVYAAVINRFTLVEDEGAGTLYVTFNPIMLAYEIHYNPKFIVETMVKHGLTICHNVRKYEQFYDELTGYTALMFSHEMEHVLRANLGVAGEQAEALKGVEHELSNLISDSVINQSLGQVYMRFTPSVGIVNDIHSTFVIPQEMRGRGDQKLYECLANASGDSFNGIGKAYLNKSRSKWIVKDPIGKITIHLESDIIDFYKENSNELTRDISKFIKKISGTLSIDELGKMLSGALEDLQKAEDSSSGRITRNSPAVQIGVPSGDSSDGGDSSDSSSSSSASGGSGGSSSDSGDKSQDSGNATGGSSDKQESDSSSSESGSSGSGSESGSGSGGSGGEDSGMEPKPIDSMSDADKSVAKSILNQIVDGADLPTLTEEETKKVETLKKDVNTEVAKKIMKSADTSILQKVNTGSSVSTWKSKFGKMLAQCLGIKEVYSNEVPSARIEGAFGREEEVPDIKTIVLAIDCSGSMGPDKFKKAIKEIELIGKAIGSNSVEVKVVYWGSSCHFYKTKGTRGLMSKIQSNSQNLGGTDFNQACDFMIKKTPRFDALMVLTDGEFYGQASQSAKSFISKNKRKVVWVLTPDGTTRYIAQYDSSHSQRLVKQK